MPCHEAHSSHCPVVHPGSSLTQPARMLRVGRVLCVLLVCWPTTGGSVMFGPRQMSESGIVFATVVAIGPENPDPMSSGDGCIYVAGGFTGIVFRVCLNAAKQVTSSTRVINLNSTSLGDDSPDVNALLGITFDPDFHPAERIVLYLAYADSPAGPFDGKIARAVSTNGGESTPT
jgi:hypothetical protein